MMADFVVPRHSAVMERLRRRIELCRRHHSGCESRYDNTAMERLEMERQHTFALHQRCLQTKAKRGSKHRQPQPAPDQTALRGAGTGGSNSDMPDSGATEQSRNSTLIALQETVKRKLENAASPLNGDQMNGFGDAYSANKKPRLDDPLNTINGVSNGLPPVSPLHQLDTKHSGSRERLLPNGNHSLGLDRLNNKNTVGLHEPSLGENRELDDRFLLKEFKQEPEDDILPSLPPAGSNLMPDLNLNEQEWKELIEELNRSVPDEDMQDIFNDDFGDRKDPDPMTPATHTLLPQDAVSIKAEFSPAATSFDQEQRTVSPQVRPMSSGPPQHTPSSTNTTKASSPAMPNSQPPSQPQRQLPQNVLLPKPSSNELSLALQLQQLAAREQQRAQLMQNQQQQQQVQQQQQQQAQTFHQTNHQPNWPQAATYGMEKPTSPSVYQQDFSNSKQMMMPNVLNKNSPKAAAAGYLQTSTNPNVMAHPPTSLNQNSVNSQVSVLNYRNTKPLSHYELDQGPRVTPPAQNKAAMLAYLQQQQQRQQQLAHLTEEQKRMIKQKPGLPYRPIVPQTQDQNSVQTVARVPGPVPTAGMGPQPPATALVGKHGNATYLNNQQQAAVLQQQQQHMQLMEKQKQLFIGQRQQLMAEQEKQRHQQEQQLQRHLTRPPPQYQDQQQNPYQQQQQVNHFQGTASSQGLVNMGNLGAQSASNQRMFSQSQGMMQMGRGQAGAPSSADPTASQPELDMPAYNSMDNVQPVMYNNMGAANQLHPHVAQQSAMSDAQLQRQPVRMGQSSTVPTGYRQNLMGSSGLTTQQLHKGPTNQALIKQQQMARMPNAMGAQAQTWQHQGMQSMNNQTPGGANNGLGVFNNTGFHMQQQPPKMANQQFSQAGLNVNRPVAAMNSAVAGQMMPTLAQQRTNQPPPQQQQPQQPVVSGMNQPVPDLTSFGQAQNPQMVNRANLHCSQGYQVRPANQELPFIYSAQSGSLQSLPGESDLMDSLMKNRTTEEWMNDLDELLRTQQ
ncbi:mastermind-like protein 1 [Acipenser ruthenus]|uniref:mastermind-like protein 1 n=1 Tax=Acipenser ruthenus TaxID=7906 RepID=UPI00156042E6|nr:mastermind-like protein 1 [Acipenser ruthenus]